MSTRGHNKRQTDKKNENGNRRGPMLTVIELPESGCNESENLKKTSSSKKRGQKKRGVRTARGRSNTKKRKANVVG